ncbi:MAG: hypothetical protein ABIZ07_06250 [Dermatophilaceae bacterium]
MPALPASVRLALWTTASWQGAYPAAESLARALPDVDHVAGDLDRLRLWHDLGERALFVALPRPGDTAGLPGTSPEAVAHAVDAGECAFVAAIGGLLVPTLSHYGSQDDTGLRSDWTAYDCAPTPQHRLEMLDLRSIEQALLASVARHTAEFEASGGSPWDAHHRDTADAAIRRGVWGLPDQTPNRAIRVIVSAARIGALVDGAGERMVPARGPVAAADVHRREQLLRSLSADADLALSGATNVAVMALAGWRPA